ncbi:unnamed protein product [Cylicostephanus goldi]|uniref:Uncharacterized protein n=1 Tax=Cylicostephanus goldi TaxID=71465 RepID=A0A3P6QT47_CYLGO|nr:unnamed protein product [Cylicostephanus goldi]
MISITAIKILADPKDRGYDVDGLEFLKVEEESVSDASNNVMKFLGGMRIQIEIEGGHRSKVAFHGENALGNKRAKELEYHITFQKPRTEVTTRVLERNVTYMGDE